MSNRAAARGQTNVAREREVHPGSDCGAVDRGDRRQRRSGDADEALVDTAQAAALRAAEVRQVGAGAERWRRAGDDDGAYVVIRLETVHRFDDLVDHRQVQRVAPLGVVERDNGDAVADLDVDQVTVSLSSGASDGAPRGVASRPACR